MDTQNVIDLGEATALLTLGFHLVRLENSKGHMTRLRPDGSQMPPSKVFVFEVIHPNTTTSNVEETIDRYNRRSLQVDAYSFYRAGKELKNRIHLHNEMNGE